MLTPVCRHMVAERRKDSHGGDGLNSCAALGCDDFLQVTKIVTRIKNKDRKAAQCPGWGTQLPPTCH